MLLGGMHLLHRQAAGIARQLDDLKESISSELAAMRTSIDGLASQLTKIEAGIQALHRQQQIRLIESFKTAFRAMLNSWNGLL